MPFENGVAQKFRYAINSTYLLNYITGFTYEKNHLLHIYCLFTQSVYL